MKHLLALICKELAEVPTEIQVIPYGINVQTPKGPYTLDEECAEEVIAAFENKKSDMVIDFEHQTLRGVEAPAAGWIKKLINKGKGGVWAAVEWTERAKQYIANREYRYVSPVILQNITDYRTRRLVNVALTNAPNIDGMVPLVNKSEYENDFEKEDLPMKLLLKHLGLAETASEQDAIIAVNKLKEPVQIVMNKNVLTALGLVETATEQDIIAAINKKTPVQIVANKAVLTALGLADAATESEVTGTIMAMKQSHDRVGTLAQEVATLKSNLGKKDATEVVALAMKEGKITPAQKDWADAYAERDIEGFKVFVAKAPVVVVQGRVVGDDNPPKDGLDETQRMINSQCGVDDETFKKYNK